MELCHIFDLVVSELWFSSIALSVGIFLILLISVLIASSFKKHLSDVSGGTVFSTKNILPNLTSQILTVFLFLCFDPRLFRYQPHGLA